jgi:Fe-S-cluster-containing hydrogenase component 2
VKAIDFKGHLAEIIEDRCILCGHCTLACPQNAKIVHSELEEVKQLLAGTDKVIASVARLNGPVCITHSPRNVVDVDKYGNEAKEKTIFNTVKLMTEF